MEICCYFAFWSWRDDVTSTCMISLITVKSCRCTYLPNLVIKGVAEMGISILISIFIWMPWRKLNSPPWILKSGIPIYNFEVLDTAGRKMRRRKQAIAKRFAFHVNAVIANFIWEETGKKTNVSQQWYKLIKMKTWTII